MLLRANLAAFFLRLVVAVGVGIFSGSLALWCVALMGGIVVVLEEEEQDWRRWWMDTSVQQVWGGVKRIMSLWGMEACKEVRSVPRSPRYFGFHYFQRRYGEDLKINRLKL